ncbi:MAG: hypothetical protein F6J86_31785 [Symploca sp. SIO1B1]|nr:hypothetical protein [Symploca sp. SIO1B1]
MIRKPFAIIAAIALFPTAAGAQDQVCYMEWEGQIIDLSSMCVTKPIETAPVPVVATNLRFYDIQISPRSDGNSLEITGTVMNESNQISSISAVRFNVISPDGSILASDTAPVEAGAGLEPGQQLAFSKIINRNILRGNLNLNDLQVEIIGSV